MSLLGRLFGSPAAVGQMVDAATKGLDALVYTDEEKAADAATDRAAARGMVIEWMRATQGQNLSRRVLAFAITFVWLIMYVFAAIFTMMVVWTDPETAAKLSANSSTAASLGDDMSGAVMLILGFYFALPHMDKIVGPAVGAMRKGNENTGSS